MEGIILRRVYHKSRRVYCSLVDLKSLESGQRHGFRAPRKTDCLRALNTSSVSLYINVYIHIYVKLCNDHFDSSGEDFVPVCNEHVQEFFFFYSIEQPSMVAPRRVDFNLGAQLWWTSQKRCTQCVNS